MAVTIHTAEDIAHMRVACRLASEVLDYITPFVTPGVTTGKLNELCHAYMRDVQGTVPAPLNYAPPGYPPFPASICTSVNDVICHGIPGDKVLKSGDIVNLDITVITKEGYYGDTSRTFVVGEGSILAKRLTQVTFECMWKGIAAVRPGARLGDIGHVIQQHAEAAGYSVVREYCGHGIGTTFHAPPLVSHCRNQNKFRLQKGHVFTIEPMLTEGSPELYVAGDGWTVLTRDEQRAAQFEHTVLVTDAGHEVLTVPPPEGE